MSEALARCLKKATKGKILFVTGAGMSATSGISTYRELYGKEWTRSELKEMNTIKKFSDDPTKWWNEYWLKQQFISQEFKPSSGHTELAKLIKELDAKVITQNIDTLHETSGLDEKCLIHAHGNIEQVRCIKCNRVVKYTFIDTKVPHCTDCNCVMIPFVLMFDESYSSHPAFRYAEVKQWVNDAEIVVFIGTSFSVGLTEFILGMVDAMDKQVFNINIELVPSGASIFKGGRIPIENQITCGVDIALSQVLTMMKSDYG